MVRQGTVYYLHTDQLGTPRAVTDTSKNVIWRWDSDPFGMMAANEDPDGDGTKFAFNLRFAGQYYDKETRLHYNYFRYYDPSTGRYITSDPIGLKGGLNTYGYVGGNPLIWIDQYGLAYSPVGEHHMASHRLFENKFKYQCKTSAQINREASALAGEVAGMIIVGPAGAIPGYISGYSVALISNGNEMSPVEDAYVNSLVESTIKPSGTTTSVLSATSDAAIYKILPEGNPTGKKSAAGAISGGLVFGVSGYVAGASAPWLYEFFKLTLEEDNKRFGCDCR
jgi:RHS repeat-associated protein